jgi:hypothetical protein
VNQGLEKRPHIHNSAPKHKRILKHSEIRNRRKVFCISRGIYLSANKNKFRTMSLIFINNSKIEMTVKQKRLRAILNLLLILRKEIISSLQL